MDYAKLVKLPSNDYINGGLTSPKNPDVIRLLGVPGNKTHDCSTPTGKVKALLATRNVGPFKVTALKPALDDLTKIFKGVKATDPELYAAIRTAGALCCRLQRGSDHLFSNHSWGTAIDLYCGDEVVPQGSHFTHAGILALYPFFHNAGWYWGAEFGNSDGMHYEVSLERLKEWKKLGLI